MFDIGWTELLVIGIVALIVVGPKDLPIMFRRLGQFTAKARGMAREFQRAMEQAADEAGVKEVSRDLRSMTSPQKLGLDKLKEATRDIRSLDPKNGPATRKLAEERTEKAARVREAAARDMGGASEAPRATPASGAAAKGEAPRAAPGTGQAAAKGEAPRAAPGTGQAAAKGEAPRAAPETGAAASGEAPAADAPGSAKIDG